LDLSNMLLDVAEVRLGVACLRRLLTLEPTNVKAWQNLAVAECARGRHDRGIDACVRALELSPGNVAVQHNLALAYLEIGRLDDAQREVRKAIETTPRDRSLGRLRLRINLACVRRALARAFGRG